MIVATPLAAIGFLTAAALTAVYCFRRKSPPKTVSSLLLWPARKAPSASARRRDRLQTPPLFWLELLILLALVTAALTPLAWRRTSGTLHVIVDDSPSMSACDGAPSHAAEAFLAAERRRGTKDAFRVRRAKDDAALRRELDAACAARAPGDEILVLTDRAPTDAPARGVRWEAFGAPAPNFAITALRRRRDSPTEDVLFVETRRFGADTPAVTLTVAPADPAHDALGTKPVTATFDAEGRARTRLVLPASAGTVRVTLPDDALAADNAVLAPPPDVPTLSVALAVTNAQLNAALKRALDASGSVRDFVAPDAADVLVTDTPDAASAPYAIVFHPSGAVRKIAPVWTDPAEPTLDGIALDGDPYPPTADTLPGRPVAFLGTIPLMSVTSNSLHVGFSDARLPFFRSPVFPALVVNALAAAHARQPHDRKERADGTNLLDPGESDLTPCATLSCGTRADAPETARRTKSVAWIPALVAILALAVHFTAVRRKMTLAILSVALAAALRPVFPLSESIGTLIVLADRSRSMTDAAKAEQQRLVASLTAHKPVGARLGIVTFGEGATVEKHPEDEAFSEFVQEPGADGSNVAAAFHRAETLVDPGESVRHLVMSDGLFTAPPPRFTPAPVDAFLQSRPFAHDLSVSRVDAPAEVAPHAVISITAWAQSPETVTNAYVLSCGANVIARGTRVFDAGLTPIVARDFATRPGLRRYTLEIKPSADDPCAENNRADFLVKVEGRRPLLFLRDGESPAAETVRRGGVPLETFRANAFPASLSALEDYGGVLLENVPTKAFASGFLRDLATYVTDLGGGLALTGGEKSFGPGGWYKTPVEDVLPVSLELRQEHRKYSLALAVVLDRSGSMACSTADGRPKMAMANLGTAAAIDMLTAMDCAAVIAVDSSPHVILPLQSAESAQEQRGKILSIESMGGGIFVEQGVLAGLRELEKADTALKHIILFADAADAEEPGDYKKYLASAADAGVTVSVIGLGAETDCDAELLRDLAKAGNGECWFEENATEIPRLFMQDTYITAKTTMCTNETPILAGAALRQISDALPAWLPNVGGYNLTYRREDAETAIWTDDDEQAPVLSFRRVGLGRTLAFAAELSGPHAAPLMTSAHGAELTAAIARWTLGDATAEAAGFTLERRAIPGGFAVTAVADTANEATAVPNSGLPLVTVTERPGVGITRTVGALTWESDDTLSGFVPLTGGETAFPAVVMPDGSTVKLPPICALHPAEFARPADPLQGLRALEKLTAENGGRILTSVEDIWKSMPKTRKSIELAPALFLFAACAFLACVFVRRLGIGLAWHFARPPERGAPAAKPKPRTPTPPKTPTTTQAQSSKSDGQPSLAETLAKAKRRAAT